MSIRNDASEATTWAAHRILVGTAMVAGLAIAGVFEATAPTIAANRAARLEAAISRVLPGASTWNRYALDNTGHLVQPDANIPATIYEARDDEGNHLGYAIRAHVMGYQDRIEAIYGYDPITDTVVGLEILASLETPGLGSRIATDAQFRANFEALDVSLDVTGTALVHAVTVVQAGKPPQPWEINAITGATVSSRAVARLFNESAARALPAIHSHRQTLDDG